MVERCIVGLGEPGNLVKSNGLETWRCRADGNDWPIRRAILNPETGSIWASYAADHDGIFSEYYKEIGKDYKWTEDIADRQAFIEKRRRPNEWSIYNQTSDGGLRNARLLDTVRKLMAQRALSVKDFLCLGTYTEHAQDTGACAEVDAFLRVPALKRCKRTTPEECPSDTGALRSLIRVRGIAEEQK